MNLHKPIDVILDNLPEVIMAAKVLNEVSYNEALAKAIKNIEKAVEVDKDA